MDYKDVCITQKMISNLAKRDVPLVCRWLSSNDIRPARIEGMHIKRFRYSLKDVRKAIEGIVFPKGRPKKSNILSFYNFKGGTGKTSICYQVSSHLALFGFNVLVIDGDPQGHLSTSFGFANDHTFPTLSDVVNGTVAIDEAIHEIYPGLSCLPSNLALTRLEVMLNELPRREERLKLILNDDIRSRYDFIIFDTNPTISLLNRNVLTISDMVSIVCETQPYSLNGLKILMEDMTKYYLHMNIDLPEVFIIPNKYEDRSTSSAEAMTVLRHYYSDYMVPDFAIRRSEDIKTSAKLNLPLAFFARSNSIAMEDITDLIHSILLKCGLLNKKSSKMAS